MWYIRNLFLCSRSRKLAKQTVCTLQGVKNLIFTGFNRLVDGNYSCKPVSAKLLLSTKISQLITQQISSSSTLTSTPSSKAIKCLLIHENMSSSKFRSLLTFNAKCNFPGFQCFWLNMGEAASLIHVIYTFPHDKWTKQNGSHLPCCHHPPGSSFWWVFLFLILCRQFSFLT